MNIKIMIPTAIFLIALSTMVYAGGNNSTNQEQGGALGALDDRKQRLNQSLQENNPDIQLKTMDDIAREQGVTTNLPVQESKDLDAPTTQNDNLSTNVNEPVRDPFNLGVDQGEFGGTAFLPSNNQQKLPRLRFKGVITERANAKDEELLALLEVNGQDVHMVRVGDEISYDLANPLAAIKIKTITRLNVTVQLGTLGNVVIVR